MATPAYPTGSSLRNGRAGYRPISRRTGPILGLLLLTLLLGNLHYLVGWFQQPPGTLFWAVPPVNYADANQYLAFTRICAEGNLLVGDPFTTVPHQPRLFQPQIHFQAALCRAFGWTPLGAYQASRILSGMLLLGAAWVWGWLLLRPWRRRWIYLALLCFSAGWGWIPAALGHPVVTGDELQPEGNTLFALGNLPNVTLSAALVVLLFAGLPALERARTRWARGAILGAMALGSFLLSWTHPFDYVTLALGLGGYGLLRWIADRRFPRQAALHAGVLFVSALPAAIYLMLLLRGDPFYRALAADMLRVRDFAYYFLTHGHLVLLALPLLAVAHLRRDLLLPLCWVVGVFLFMLLPLPLGGKQSRLVGGIHPALCVLAAAGIDTLAGFLSRPLAGHEARPWLRWALVLLAMLWTAPGAYHLLQRQTAAVAPLEPYFYMERPVREMFAVLAREGRSDEVVLGGEFTGGWAPTFAAPHAFHGHWHMTLQAEARREERNRFFLTAEAAVAKGDWLRSQGIDWVIWYPWEWGGRLPYFDPIPGIRRAYDSPEVILYRLPAAATP